MNWRHVILFATGLFLVTHLLRFFFSIAYGLWVAFMSEDFAMALLEILVAIVIFMFYMRLALAEHGRVMLHLVAVLVLSSVLEWIWFNFVSALGRDLSFIYLESALLAVLAYVFSLLFTKSRDQNL
jgi:hypothetical protein